ncbi:GAF domain-containing protein [Methylorubrum sp. SB2]|uniref:GAF domain-containing protein n=1 Tax=Methylorubrum subtropicum TaxID=3138812 RepID=UPI00313DF93A
MIESPLSLDPEQVAERVAALHGYAILDTPAEQGFDDIVQLATLLCQTPVALVSLVDEDRQWFKARVNFPACQTDLDSSVCVHALAGQDVLVIPDLTRDPRTAANPLVTSEPFIRFYAGAPLRTASGLALGSLCVIDKEPRPAGLTPDQSSGLQALARQVISQLELRRAVGRRDALLTEQRADIDARDVLRQTQAAVAVAGNTFDVMLEAVVAGAMRAVPAAEAGVAELIDGDALEYRAVQGTLKPHRGLRVPLNGSMAGRCARTGQPLLFTDMVTEPGVDQALVARLAVRSAMFAPIVRGGTVIGVLKLQASKLAAFDDRDLQQLMLFANVATAALAEASEAAAREAARLADERLQMALTASGMVGLWDWMIDTDLLHGDASFARMYGLDIERTAAGITMEQYQEFVVPDDLAPLRASIAATFDHGAPFQVEYRLALSGEPLRWVECKGRLIYDDRGQAVRFSGTAVDITEQHAMRAALVDSDERLNLAFSASHAVGWYDWQVPIDRMFGSANFARMFSVDPAVAAAGAPLMAYFEGIHPDDRERVGVLVQGAMDGGTTFDADYRLRDAGGTVTWVHSLGRISYDTGGQPVRFSGIITDITERLETAQRREALLRLGDQLRDLDTKDAIAAAAAEVVGTTLGLTRAGYGSVEAARETIQIEQDWALPELASIAGRHTFRSYGSYVEQLKAGEAVVIADTAGDPRTRATAEALQAVQARALVNLPIMERGRFVGLFFMLMDQPRVWTEAELAFLRTVADRTRAAIARIEAEDRQSLLNRELSHRMKNILAMVQAIATQTLRNTADPTAAREALAARLIALGKAHDILMSGEGQSALMDAVIRDALKIHDDSQSGRFRLDGPRVACSDKSGLSMALMVHELATNAAKYGALSTSSGYVAITWKLDGPADAETLTLIWQEHGGPTVTPPVRVGFGSKLIQRGLAGAVGGTVALTYPPEGVVCTLVAPLSGFSDDAVPV